MGNCLSATDVARNSSLASDRSKVTSKTSSSSAPSTLTCSTPSTLTVASCSETSVYGSLPTSRTEGEILSSSNAKAITFSELKNASRNFRSDSLIGEGGFGYVYKGWLDEFSLTAAKPGTGIAVAIKKLKSEGFQGHKEWLTEVDYLGRLQHPNLVKLIGYCTEGDNRLLVYEYMPKGSLEYHIFRRNIQPLSWGLRMKVAVDAARGLAFLHDAESQVIYRDVKASNILLDMDYNAKLSDFGLAKAGPTGGKTHVSTRVMGTQGYAAPEYVATGRLTAMADVYSFGVVLLELLSGRRALDKSKVGNEQNLVVWAKLLLSDKHKISRVMDTRLVGQYPKKGASAVAALALRCLSNEAKRRPQMSQVLAALEKQQDLKEAVNLPQADEQNASMPIPRSPMTHQRSPNRTVPGGSPLQPCRQAMPVH